MVGQEERYKEKYIAVWYLIRQYLISNTCTLNRPPKRLRSAGLRTLPKTAYRIICKNDSSLNVIIYRVLNCSVSWTMLLLLNKIDSLWLLLKGYKYLELFVSKILTVRRCLRGTLMHEGSTLVVYRPCFAVKFEWIAEQWNPNKDAFLGATCGWSCEMFIERLLLLNTRLAKLGIVNPVNPHTTWCPQMTQKFIPAESQIYFET